MYNYSHVSLNITRHFNHHSINMIEINKNDQLEPQISNRDSVEHRV